VRLDYRLRAPGVVFFLVSVLTLSVLPWHPLEIHGGLAALGAYCLLWQVSVATFAVVAIDDFGDRRPGSGFVRHADYTFARFSSILVELYRRTFVNSLLMAFGIGTSLSIIVIGLAEVRRDGVTVARSGESVLGFSGLQHSEVVLFALLLAVMVACVCFRSARRALAGWCCGFGAAAAAAEIRAVRHTEIGATILGWVIATAVVVAIGVGTELIVEWIRQKHDSTPLLESSVTR
jgi:hypothetical protein